MNKAKLAAAAVSLLAVCGTAGAQQQSALAASDQRILEKLAQANIAEIDAGKLALQKSQNEQVKSFAQQMVDDHTKGLQEVQKVASSKNVTLPSETDASHKAMAAKLGALSGDAFDRAYMNQAGVSEHRKTHAYVQKVQSDAKDADVKALAAKLEPTVAQHLGKVEQMSASLGTPTTTDAGTSRTRGKNRTKPDTSSGNTDNPANQQNPATHPPGQ